MSIELPTTPAPTAAEVVPMEWGGEMRPPLGGPIQYLDRLGTRWSIAVTLPPMCPDDARHWVARRLQSKTLGELLVWRGYPQMVDNEDFGDLVVAGSGALGAYLPVEGGTPGTMVKAMTMFSFVADGRHWMHQVAEDFEFESAGVHMLPINPILRTSPPDGAALEFEAPVIEGMIAGPASWKVDTLRLHGVEFTIFEDE